MKNVRIAAVAGMFYPASAKKLSDEIKLMLDLSKPDKKFEHINGIISPHAGYIYSGRTAAYAFNAVAEKNYKTVIIISPSHREYFPGISIYHGDAYETPLGIVPVNNEVREKLIADSKLIFSGVLGHRAEHAVEVQIPFLQVIMRDFSLVPIVMGDQNKVCVNELAEKLSNVMDEQTLVVASSDLSHYYKKAEADRLDSVVEKRISNFDYEGLQADLETGKCEACGGGAIVAMMKAADMIKAKNSLVLSRSDSGDVSGDNSQVVGYLSAAVFN
ncbi:MAG: AmmeMemoRadiSam system protein B [Bacteroidota bacterium]